MTKKIAIVVGIIMLATLLLTGCDIIMEKTVDETEYINPISLAKAIEKINEEESFNLIIGTEGCPACAAYLKELQKFHNKENYKFYYMKYGQDINMELLKEFIIEKLDENVDMFAVPTTYFIVNGEVVDKVVGAIKADEIKLYEEYYK